MPRYPQRIWLVAIITALSVDFLFWDKPVGISFLIFIAIALVALYLAARQEAVLPARATVLLAALVLLMSTVNILRSEPFTRVINGLFALAVLALLLITFQSGAWTRYRSLDFLGAGMKVFVLGLTRAAGLRLAPGAHGRSAGRSLLTRSLPFVRGILFALPVVVLLAALLASADLVFSDRLRGLLSIFDIDRLPEYIFRLALIAMMAYCFAGLVAEAVAPRPLFGFSPVTAGQRAAPENSPAAAESDGDTPNEGGADALVGDAAPPTPASSEPEWGMRILGATEAWVILGSVDLLFAAFVAVQFRYFFGGQGNISSTGYTYAEYARKGFTELVLVAVISLLLYLLLNAITRRKGRAQERTFTVLSVLLVGFVLVILVSAFQRLLLYEAAYGFTRLRMYTHIFIPWLGFFLVAVIALEVFRRERFFGALALLTVIGFALTFGALNVDGLIASHNAQRAREGKSLDAAYLASLSDDALPVLAREYTRPDQPEFVRSAAGRVLACRLFSLSQANDRPWQAYHPGSAAALRSLAGLDLSAYTVEMQRGMPVVTYNGFTRDCYEPVLMD